MHLNSRSLRTFPATIAYICTSTQATTRFRNTQLWPITIHLTLFPPCLQGRTFGRRRTHLERSRRGALFGPWRQQRCGHERPVKTSAAAQAVRAAPHLPPRPASPVRRAERLHAIGGAPHPLRRAPSAGPAPPPPRLRPLRAPHATLRHGRAPARCIAHPPSSQGGQAHAGGDVRSALPAHPRAVVAGEHVGGVHRPRAARADEAEQHADQRLRRAALQVRAAAAERSCWRAPRRAADLLRAARAGGRPPLPPPPPAPLAPAAAADPAPPLQVHGAHQDAKDHGSAGGASGGAALCVLWEAAHCCCSCCRC